MRIGPQMIASMKADSSVQAAIGDQIYADYPPQGVDNPFVILTITSTQAHGTIDNRPVRAYSARITIDVVADTRAQTEVGVEAIEDVLDGLTSTDPNNPIQGITVDGGIQWEVLNPKDGSDERAFVGTQNYQVHYRRNL